MSLTFSAGQFDAPGRSTWEVPKAGVSRMPATRGGTTAFIVDDNGHLLGKKAGAWPPFRRKATYRWPENKALSQDKYQGAATMGAARPPASRPRRKGAAPHGPPPSPRPQATRACRPTFCPSRPCA